MLQCFPSHYHLGCRFPVTSADFWLCLRKFCGEADRGKLAGQWWEFKIYRKSTAQTITTLPLSKFPATSFPFSPACDLSEVLLRKANFFPLRLHSLVRCWRHLVVVTLLELLSTPPLGNGKGHSRSRRQLCQRNDLVSERTAHCTPCRREPRPLRLSDPLTGI